MPRPRVTSSMLMNAKDLPTEREALALIVDAIGQLPDRDVLAGVLESLQIMLRIREGELSREQQRSRDLQWAYARGCKLLAAKGKR